MVTPGTALPGRSEEFKAHLDGAFLEVVHQPISRGVRLAEEVERADAFPPGKIRIPKTP